MWHNSLKTFLHRLTGAYHKPLVGDTIRWDGIQWLPHTPTDISAAWPIGSVFTSVVATNQNATATNQSTTATNQNATATNQNATATNQSTGGSAAHNNVQPYFVVKYWKRVS